MQSPFGRPAGVPSTGITYGEGTPSSHQPRGSTDSSSYNYRAHSFDVFVGRIPQDWSERKLWEIFLPFGQIKSVQCNDSTDFKNGRKIAFVRFAREEDAKKSVEAISRNGVNNVYLQVNMAQRTKKKERQGGSEVNQGRKQYTDFKKSSSNSGESGGNQQGHSWPANRNDNKWGTSGQSSRVRGVVYGGGYSSVSSNDGQNPGQIHTRNSPDQSGPFHQQKQPWKCSSDVPKRSVLREEVILVTEVETSITFWGQVGIPRVAHSLANSSEELQAYCPTGQKLTTAIQENKVYGGLYPCDNLWYRCNVQELLPEGMVKVKYIDYGNVESIHQDYLVELPPSLADLPPFAHLYQLADCTVCSDPPSAAMTNPLAFEQLKNLINGRLVTVKVLSQNNSGVCDVLVNHPDMSGKTINDVMIAGGCLQRIKKNDGGRVERSVAEKPLIGDQKGSGESINKKISKQEFDNLKKTIKFQSETICNLNKLFETVKQQNEELNQELSKAFNQKVKFVLSTVVELNQSRERCMLTEAKTKVLDDGILLVSDGDSRLTLEHVESFSKVCFSSDALKQAQDAIRNCQDKETLKEVIDQRNRTKQELIDNIKEFLLEVSSLDLDQRDEKLKEGLTSLNIFHQRCDGENPLLEQAIEKYREWKNNQFSQMDCVQQATDSASSKLADEFAKLQKLLDPALDFTLNDCDPVDIDSIAQEYCEAVAKETQQTQVGEDRVGVEIVSALIKALKKELQHELSDIVQLRTSAEKYTKLQENLERWLHSEPDVSKVVDIRKDLKSVKSEFRHKLVDKKDLEEGDDLSDGEDLKKVEEDLLALRSQLHQLLSDEMTALQELAELATDHFPEMSLKFPELGLQKFIETYGLVKQGWELTYYSHSEMLKIPARNASQVVFQTAFGGVPCALKEFNLADITDLDLFESRAVSYNTVDSSNLLKLQALFYDKTNRKAFIHLPYLETNLKMWLATNPSDKSKRDVIRDVIRALCALHKAGITHGSVVMENVFVDKDARGILGEYCFISDTQQRVSSTAEILLKNVVPVSCDTSPLFDIYCLGQMACQVFFGDIPSVRDASSLQNLTQNKSLVLFLIFLLALDGGTRPTASQLLQHPFLTNEDVLDTVQSAPGEPVIKNDEQEPSCPQEENTESNAQHENDLGDVDKEREELENETTFTEEQAFELEKALSKENPSEVEIATKQKKALSEETVLPSKNNVLDGEKERRSGEDELPLLEENVSREKNNEIPDVGEERAPVEDELPVLEEKSKDFEEVMPSTEEKEVCGQNAETAVVGEGNVTSRVVNSTACEQNSGVAKSASCNKESPQSDNAKPVSPLENTTTSETW